MLAIVQPTPLKRHMHLSQNTGTQPNGRGFLSASLYNPKTDSLKSKAHQLCSACACPSYVRNLSNVLWMDENPTPPKKPWNDDSPVNTNENGFPWFPSGANGFPPSTVWQECWGSDQQLLQRSHICKREATYTIRPCGYTCCMEAETFRPRDMLKWRRRKILRYQLTWMECHVSDI